MDMIMCAGADQGLVTPLERGTTPTLVTLFIGGELVDDEESPAMMFEIFDLLDIA